MCWAGVGQPQLGAAEDAGGSRRQGDGSGRHAGPQVHRHLFLRPHLQALGVRVTGGALTCHWVFLGFVCLLVIDLEGWV